MVRRDLREEVVDDMELDDVVKHMLANEAKFSVNRSGSAFEESPSFGLEFREVGVCVVEVGDGDYPVIDPHVGLDVKERDHKETDLSGCVMKYYSHKADAEVGENDEVSFFRSKDRTVG